MPKLKAKLTGRQDMFGSGLQKRIDKMLAAEEAARQVAANEATAVTRAGFKRTRQIIPPRRGRSSTGGRMQQALRWVNRPNGTVVFDMKTADTQAPHWIIQEIGTGARATLRQGGSRGNPVGRPKEGASYIRTVKPQKGRRISGGLVFATGGKYSPPGARRDEQLHWASKVLGVPQHSASTPRGQAAGIRIRNEIRGQGFVQRGGDTAFRQYRTTVLEAARQAFLKGNQP